MYGGRGREVFNTIDALNTNTWVWENQGIGGGDFPLEGNQLNITIPYLDSAILQMYIREL